MSRFAKVSLLSLMAAAGACNSADLVVETENLPYAGVRFLNGVVDTAGAFGLDFRFVDILESNAHFRITFRNSPTAQAISQSVQYKGAREGNRHFKIFLDDTIQAIASVALKDSTMNITRGHNYTVMLWGSARAAVGAPDEMRLNVWEDTLATADPGAGKIFLRVINATSNTIDAWAFPTGTAAPALASAPTWDNVAPYSRSAYVVVDSGSYTYQVRNDGAAAVLFANTAVGYTGVVPTCGGSTPTATNPSGCKPGEHADVDAVPGTKVAGSAVSGIVWPRSTAGTRTPQTAAFGAPVITFVWDKRPPRTCDPWC